MPSLRVALALGSGGARGYAHRAAEMIDLGRTLTAEALDAAGH
jgi:predicted acylesterase/phospholipase RssA